MKDAQQQTQEFISAKRVAGETDEQIIADLTANGWTFAQARDALAQIPVVPQVSQKANEPGAFMRIIKKNWIIALSILVAAIVIIGMIVLWIVLT